MPARDRIAFPIGINTYVPAMAYASDVVHGQPTAFSLGSPAAESANNIANATITANSAAGTAFTVAYTSDSKYGRSLRYTPSGNPGATGGTFDVFGFDYLGQPMVERISGTNGSTSIVYGKKAFGRVTQVKIVTPSTNAITWNIGTGRRMGLPYKGDIAWAMEAGVQVPIFKRDQDFFADRAAAQAVAGGSKWVRPAFPGFVKTLIGVPDGGGGATDPVITVKLATVAITGLTVTIDTSDTTGATVTSTPSTPGYNANNRFVAGGLIEIVGAAAAGAFGDRVGLTLTPTQFTLPDLTDPNTNLLGDPRGTYEPVSAPAGNEIVVGLVGDSAVNTSGNGGLMGIRHAAT
jgi:hypothetical protein